MSVVEPRRGQAEADPSQIVGELYREARRDMGQSPDEDLGATGEVSARALLRMGLIVDAYAVSGTEELLHVLLERGPVVCGMTWRQSMFEPQVVDGQLVCTAGQDAPVVGGHCVVLNGVDLDLELAGTKGFVRFKNSWARGWGDRGHALLSLDDLAEVASSDQQTLLAMPARMFLEPWALPDVAYADVVSKLPMGENGSNLGWNFLEKIVHVPLNLPEMRGSGKKGFVGTLFRHVEATPPRSDGEGALLAAVPAGARLDAALPGTAARPEDTTKTHEEKEAIRQRERLLFEDPQVQRTVAYAMPFLDATPRQLKRFVNIFRFFAMVTTERDLEGRLEAPIPLDAVAKLAVLNLRWPWIMESLLRPLAGKERRTLFETVENGIARERSNGAPTKAAWARLVAHLTESGFSQSMCERLASPALLSFIQAEPKAASAASVFV